MANGVLENQSQSFNVDIQIDARTEQALIETADGQSIDIEVTAIKGHTGNSDIFISSGYDNLEVCSTSHDVEIISELPSNRMVKAGTKIKLKVTPRIGKNSSATFLA